VFQQYPTLAPVSHIGLPEFEIHLQEPWNDKLVYQWTEFFEKYSDWSPYLLVTNISRKCFVFTYAVFPIFVPSVVRSLTDPEILRELEENGIKVELSDELLEMNRMISIAVKNEEDFKEAEKQIARPPKQLSSEVPLFRSMIEYNSHMVKIYMYF